MQMLNVEVKIETKIILRGALSVLYLYIIIVNE